MLEQSKRTFEQNHVLEERFPTDIRTEVTETRLVAEESKTIEETGKKTLNLSETLESLRQEEAALMDQKSQLLNIEEHLWLRIIEEMESRKQRIDNLKTEIPELKQKCTQLAKILEIPVYGSPAH
jgi:hypothetical protein